MPVNVPKADATGQIAQSVVAGLEGDLMALSNSVAAITAEMPLMQRKSVIDVRDYGAVGDGVTDDIAALQAAVDAAGPGSKVYIPSGTYLVSSFLEVGGHSNWSLIGDGPQNTKIISSKEIGFWIRNSTGDVEDFEVGGFTLEGTVVDDAPEPRRSRTHAGHAGFQGALILQGVGVPGSTVTHTVKNIRIDRLHVSHVRSLPILLMGVSGYAVTSNCTFYNTMDAGWVSCDNVLLVNCTSERSHDNGFSMSRGCKNVAITGCTAKDSAHYGMWVGGWIAQTGPQNLSMTACTMTNSGMGGIFANDAPQRMSIVGNTVYGVRRGPVDAPADHLGMGIIVGGAPTSDPGNPTTFAEDITIVGNTVVDAARCGITVRGTKRAKISDNIITNCGSEFFADGTSPVGAAATSQNFGIGCEPNYAATCDNIHIQNNLIVDTRSPAVMNEPVWLGAATNSTAYQNQVSGGRKKAVSRGGPPMVLTKEIVHGVVPTPGSPIAGVGVGGVISVPADATLTAVRITANEAPTGSGLTVRVLVNSVGWVLVTIPDGSRTGVTKGENIHKLVDEGAILSFAVTAVGATTAGSDLTISIIAST